MSSELPSPFRSDRSEQPRRAAWRARAEGSLVAALLLASATLIASNATADQLLVDTGSTAPPGGFLLLESQQIAGIFTLSEPTLITSAGTYLDSDEQGSIAVRLLADDEEEQTPSPRQNSYTTGHLFETTIEVTADFEGWLVLDDLNWILEPGNYWLAIRADTESYVGRLDPPVDPLEAYASFVEVNGLWFPTNSTLSVRVYGELGPIFVDGFESGDLSAWSP